MIKSCVVACAVAAALFTAPVALSARQRPRPATPPPLPPGQRIVALDGDTVVVENDARVRFVRRREANVRAIYNGAQRWLVLLVDYSTPPGPDGGVDATYNFTGLSGGDWPLDPRWEGPAVIEDYGVAGEMRPSAVGIVTPAGLVQITSGYAEDVFRDPGAAAVLTAQGSGRGGGGNRSFDETEAQQVAVAKRNAEQRNRLPSSFSTSMGASVTPGSLAGGVVVIPGDGAPVRVGGSIRHPQQLVDVKPVTPETALNAGIRGVVILEITIDTDGSVREARVLRSIPLLDAAALEAARQWRFEPTLLNGRPVPVVMTVTVPF